MVLGLVFHDLYFECCVVLIGGGGRIYVGIWVTLHHDKHYSKKNKKHTKISLKRGVVFGEGFTYTEVLRFFKEVISGLVFHQGCCCTV